MLVKIKIVESTKHPRSGAVIIDYMVEHDDGTTEEDSMTLWKNPTDEEVEFELYQRLKDKKAKKASGKAGDSIDHKKLKGREVLL
jgi:hypothetical protein